MVELWTSLPVEIKASVIAVAIYTLDAIATATPNPLDNLIVRGIKAYREKRK